MSEKPIHNSGAELASRTIAELEAELEASFPGGSRWQGITYELQRRSASRQELLIRWTFGVSIASLLIGVVGVITTTL